MIRPIALPAALLTLLPAMALADAHSGTRNVLVFGDSLTWGWAPTSPIAPTTRHAPEDRWTAHLATALGDGYDIVVEGLSARTTNMDDPNFPGLMNGADYLDSAITSHDPLDLVIIMLGTNDTKTYLDRSPFEIGLGMGELVNIVQEGPGTGFTEWSVPEILVLSPPPLGPEIDPAAADIFEGGQAKLDQLPRIYGLIAEAAGAHVFDAASVLDVSGVGVDGIHLKAEANATLGNAVADAVRAIME